MLKSSKLKETPLVSVIMPVYNAGEFLVSAIESILNQTYKNFELIIVNDASIDNSLNIVKKYQKQYPRKIKVISLKKNLNRGGDACANLGFQKARGDFIARMDADDISHPLRLEKQVAFLKENPKVIVLGTQAYVLDKNGLITGEKSEPLLDREIRQNYFIYHPVIHPSVMIRKSLLPKRKSLYTIRYSANNDLLTFFELLRYGQFANLAEKLIYYRIHGKNDSLVNPKEKFFNTLKIRLFAWRHLGFKPTLKGVLFTAVQATVISLLPSSVILLLYLIWRGLAKPRVFFSSPKLASSNL